LPIFAAVGTDLVEGGRWPNFPTPEERVSPPGPTALEVSPSTGVPSTLNTWKSGNRRQLGHKVALVLFATVVGLFLAEGVARLTFSRSRWTTVSFGHNHIIRKQADDFPSFEVDDELGHQLVGGKFIDAYRTGLVSLEEIVADPRWKGPRIVLPILGTTQFESVES
jgi:hypothetical protein